MGRQPAHVGSSTSRCSQRVRRQSDVNCPFQGVELERKGWRLIQIRDKSFSWRHPKAE